MTVHYQTNLAADVGPWLVRSAAGFGLDGPSASGGGTVGDRAAHALAVRIHDRGIAFVGTSGAWPMNAESTAKAKGFNAPNFETGEMLSPESIAGEVTSTHDETTIVQGTGATDDDGVSDRDRAYYAETGQSALRIVRSFFGVIDTDADALTEIVGDEWEAHARQP